MSLLRYGTWPLLVVGLVSCPVVLLGQSPSSGQAGLAEVGKLIAEAKAAENGQTQPSHSFFGEYNQEAASSNAAGIQKYSEDLIGLIVPDGVDDKDYVRSLSKRLARAEQRAREGKGKLVPEAAIARSFDDLMQGIGAPPAWKSDLNQLRTFRARSAGAPNLSALFTAGRNGTNCNPGEAVLLLYMLLINNGKLTATSSDLGNAPANQQSSKLTSRIGGPDQDGSELLAAYSLTHNHHDVKKLFDHIAQTLNF